MVHGNGSSRKNVRNRQMFAEVFAQRTNFFGSDAVRADLFPLPIAYFSGKLCAR